MAIWVYLRVQNLPISSSQVPSLHSLSHSARLQSWHCVCPNSEPSTPFPSPNLNPYTKSPQTHRQNTPHHNAALSHPTNNPNPRPHPHTPHNNTLPLPRHRPHPRLRPNLPPHKIPPHTPRMRTRPTLALRPLRLRVRRTLLVQRRAAAQLLCGFLCA